MEQEETKNNKSEIALREEKVLEFWRENKIFEKSLDKKSPEGEFVFYDGPVTANSKPVLHTMTPFSFKDVIPRYKTMRGYHVRRKGGWDTHGLPVELQIEKKLGFKSKTDIENYGIAAFNKLCKESISEYIGLWKDFTKRMGYWADQENAYVTYHNEYMESLWNVVKKINEQKLLYKDYRIVPWCPRCGTALSSHELAQGYEDVKDLSVTVKFKIKGFENGYFLAWTTTPWTLPGNVALAVGENIDYVEAKVARGNTSEILVLAKERLSILTEPYEIVAEHKGKEMIGMEYEPLYPYLVDIISAEKEHSEKPKLEKAFKVYGADFVTTTDGTGIVHTAVMYGQDDFVLGTKVGLPKYHLVNPEGKFIKGTGFLEGRYVREVNADGKPTLAVDIIEDLKKRNLFFKQENYKHQYPHCWRCHTPLIYYARDSWYIRMSSPLIKKELIDENKKINWEPDYIRDGRFGEWLREIKDWAISRERYWGTPLPVWTCEVCKKIEIIGSIADLKEKTKKSGNMYFVMRHGESESNVKNNMHGVVSSRLENIDHLTKKGIVQVEEAAKKLKNKKIDLIFVSPFMRTKETLEILKKNLGFTDEQIIFDKRLGELDAGDFEGKSWDEYRDMFIDEKQRFLEPIHGGESILDVKKRMGDFIYELEEKYQDKNILMISHGSPLWMLYSVLNGYNTDESIDMTNGLFRHSEEIEKGFTGKFHLFSNAEYRIVDFVSIPHNENYELDLHRPYIDGIELACECAGNLIRTKEVMDVWFDSGAMPFAQDHYPFNSDLKKILYPADYICEAIDQTRGWFYTLHAVGILMGRGKAYKNVICLGHLLDASGKKMSKSVGNVIDPWTVMDKYGVDTLRMWMYSVNQPGESKNFDEKTVALLHQQVFGLLYNILAFYELYRDKSLETNYQLKPKNILDQWILARLNELIELSTENLDTYKLLEPVRAIRDFVGDLSTWYLRRSRERIKENDLGAKSTLYFILKTLAKVMAPFAPFTAEDIWLKLKTEKDLESVHLVEWPKASKVDLLVLKNMQNIRDICTMANAERQKLSIPVRQPLNKLFSKVSVSPEFQEIIKDELNVKEVVIDISMENMIGLDTKITPALKAEGEYREFMRELQGERKKLGLNPGDKMAMSIEMLYKKYKIMPSLQDHMLRVAAVASMICDNFTESINKEEIITACLLHDMGNIIKSDFKVFPDFFQPEGFEYWEKVKQEYIEKYGTEEHVVHNKIAHEVGVKERIIELMDAINFLHASSLAQENDFGRKIIQYCDDRVMPLGVVSLEERLADLRKRYGYKGGKESDRDAFDNALRQIEKQIFTKCKIKPEDINDRTVAPIIAELKNFMIK
jgi:isoleucyl-tRNA synthetase